jgi:type I restriction enzyme, S subunit
MNYPPAQIGQLCLPTEQLDPRDTPYRPFKYVDISSVDKDLKAIVQTQEIIGKDAPSRARKVISADDVLISTVRPNLNAVAIVPSELDGQIASTGFCVLRSNPSVVSSRYLFYRTLTQDFVCYLTARMQGANYPAVTEEVVRKATIPIPPLSEQQRIVEILDQADALRKKRAEADAKSEFILPALFYKMFGDPTTNPKGWEMVPLKGLSIGGQQYGANAKAIGWSEGMPRYVRITDIKEDGSLNPRDIKTLEIEDWKPYALEGGDLLFARSGATVGKTYLYQSDDGLCAFAGYLIRFKIDQSQINPWVVFALTQTSYYEGWVSSKRRTAAQPNINGQEYASLVIPKPTKKLQQTFAAAAKNVVILRNCRSKMIDKIESVFSLLLQHAFSGYLTANWREGHMKELLAEMEEQAKYLAALGPQSQRENKALQEFLF